METVIGVFASRERAEECVKQLLGKHVPEDTIVFLTRSESEAMTLGKSLGAYAGGLVGGAAGLDRKSTRLNSSHLRTSRMPSSA